MAGTRVFYNEGFGLKKESHDSLPDLISEC
jgi:hypothetical protein